MNPQHPQQRFVVCEVVIHLRTRPQNYENLLHEAKFLHSKASTLQLYIGTQMHQSQLPKKEVPFIRSHATVNNYTSEALYYSLMKAIAARTDDVRKFSSPVVTQTNKPLYVPFL